MRGLRWALLAALCVGAARADLDTADYVGAGKTTPAGRTREQIEREVAREIEQQARKEQREAEEQARRREQAEAEEARRPYPQRLLQSRCTLCHTADYYLNQRHTALGWHLVILRMRWFNRATMAWPEQAVLAAELNRIRPAGPAAALIEYAGAAAALVLPSLMGWGAWRWRRRAKSSLAH